MGDDSRLRPVLRGLRGRCPVCGERQIWRTRWRLVETCPRCELRFERREGQFVGAVGINTIVTFGLMLAAMVAGLIITWPDVALVPMLIVCVGIAALVPIAIHGRATTTWLGLDLLFIPLEPHEAPGRGSIDTAERPGE